MIRYLLTACFLMLALVSRAQPGSTGPTPSAGVTSLVRASASPTSAASVSYTLTTTSSVTGLSAANFSLINTTTTGASITSVSGSGTTYTIVVGTGTGSGSLQLQLTNSTGVSPALSNVPFDGEVYTIDRTAPAMPAVTAPATGSSINTGTPTYSGTAEAGSTVTVYVDNTSIGTTTATAVGSFALTQPTALANGTHTVYVTATDALGNTSVNSSTNTFTVDTTAPTVTISSSAGVSGSTTGTSPIPFTVTFSEAVTGFVAGDVSVSNGTLSGFAGSGMTYTFNVTPTTAGTATTVNVAANVAQDGAGNGNTVASPFNITYVAPIITLAPAVLPSGTAATAYSQSITATGGTAPYSYAITAGALPAGLTLSSAGVLSGTPTAGGSFALTVRATDASATPGPYSGSRSYTLTIGAPTITVAPTALPDGTQGTAYSQTLTATGGTAPYSYALTAGALPTGLMLASNGTLSGTPTAGGSFTFTVTATDASAGSGPYSGSRSYTVNVTALVVTVAPTTPTLPSGTVGTTYSQTFTATGGTAPYSYAITAGALPAGLTLSSAGVLSGTPTAGGSFTFTVRATDSTTPTAISGSRSYTLIISAPTVTVAPATLPDGTAGTAYSQTVSASGGTAPYTFAVTAGALPTGLTLSSGGVLAGTPTTSGSFTFTVTATDASAGSGPYTGSRSYTVTIAGPATVAWNGSVSTDWYTAANWTPNVVPTTTTDATIPGSATNQPSIAAGTASVRNLTINAGATLSQTGGTLDVRADLTNNGTFGPTGGTVILGTAFQSNGPNILGSSRIRFWNLTVNSNGVLLSTSAGASVRLLLTLNGALVTQGNSFTLESNSGGTALVVNNTGGFVFGNATVQRYIDPTLNAGLGYRHYSAPVGNSTVADLATAGFTPVVNNAYNTSTTPTLVMPFPTVYGYDQARLASSTSSQTPFDKGFFSPAALSDGLTVGRGYTVNIGASQLVDFVGPLNNGGLSLSLARNSGATAADAGWQLLGNPYPAPLDYSLVAPADRANLDGAIYVFQSTSQYAGQYRAYVNGLGGNPVLPVGQGFFARVSTGQTSGTLTFRNSQRLTTPDATAFQRTTTETRPLLQLTLHGAASTTASDDAYVYFQAGATAGIDPQYDAVKLPNSTGLNLASIAVGTQLAINGLPVGSTTTVTVPLFVGLPATGTYTLNAVQVLNFTPSAQPFLRDLQLGTLTDLSVQPVYTFTQNAFSTAPRFEVVFGPQQVLGTASAALASQVAVFPNPAHAAIAVELPAALRQHAVMAALVDALGRVVLTQELPAGRSIHTLPLANVAAGVYSLRLQTAAGVVVKKLVVE